MDGKGRMNSYFLKRGCANYNSAKFSTLQCRSRAMFTAFNAYR